MKKQLLTALAVVASLCGYAQTKGTSTLGLGVNISTIKAEDSNTQVIANTTKTNDFSFGYGLFIKDNVRLGIELNYGSGKSTNSDAKTKTYGANVSYQQYYPLIKKLYAYAGGRAGYGQTKQESFDEPNFSSIKGMQYSAGVYGGITWFVSKRFAFETSLLSADAFYNISKQRLNDAAFYEVKQTNFNLNSRGFINDLGFKIYLLF